MQEKENDDEWRRIVREESNNIREMILNTGRSKGEEIKRIRHQDTEEKVNR